MRRTTVCMFALPLALIVAGCAGTARKSPIEPIDSVQSKGILSLVGAYDEDARNAWMERNVIRIDEDFDRYRASLQRARTVSGTSSATVALLSNVASSLTQSAGVKANYVGLNGIATGVNDIAFKQKFMEQTVASLMAAMDGRRAEAYTRLRIGMLKSVREYTLADANRDVRAYAWAGRVEEGMSFVADATGTAAREAVAQSDQDIARVVSYTEAERQLSFCVSESLDRLGAKDLNAMKQVFLDLNLVVPAGADVAALVHAITVARLNSTPEFQRAVNAAMTSRHLLLDPCPEY